MGKMSSFEVQEGKLDYQQIFNEVKNTFSLQMVIWFPTGV